MDKGQAARGGDQYRYSLEAAPGGWRRERLEDWQ